MSGADPKGKIEVANLLHDAMLDVEDAKYSDAIPRLEQVLKEQPDMPVAQMQYGIAQSRLKRYDKALPSLQKAVHILPDNGMGHYELGLALFETGTGNLQRPSLKQPWAALPAGPTLISRWRPCTPASIAFPMR